MKLVTRTLKKAIQDFNAAEDHQKRSLIAIRWFERNAEITLEEVMKLLKEGS